MTLSVALSVAVINAALLAVGPASPPPEITNQAAISPFLAEYRRYHEVPPYLLRIDNRVRVYSTAGCTYAAWLIPGQSLLRTANAIDASTDALASQYDIYQPGGQVPPRQLDPATYWRRNYYGIFSAQLLHHPATGQRCVVAFLHGENKNEVLNKAYYDNTVKSSRTYAPSQYSGYDATGAYHDHWANYFGFVGMAWSPLEELDGNNLMVHDTGPVLWPCNGYVDARDTPLSAGLRHPYSLVADGFIYVFCQDASFGATEGRRGGIKVARAATSSMGLPNSFKNYYNEAFTEPSLPQGFDKNGRSFFAVPGGKSTTLFDFDKNATSFRVARLKNSPYFIGLEEVQNWDNTNLVLQMRYSTDLAHWSQPADVPGTRTNVFSSMKLNYGGFMNLDCTSSSEIDAEGFYIVGSDNRARPHYRYTTIAVPRP
jgi:hypothetical protein